MTKIIAHRGSKGTHPENTLVAFKEAIECGADGIELDVQFTKDGELVVIHDNQVDRTTNGTGEIISFTLRELKMLDAGSWFNPEFKDERIPTFSEVLEVLFQDNFKGLLNIELKTDEKDYPGIEEAVSDLLHKRNWPFTYMYSSFNFDSVERMHQLEPTIPLAYIMGDQPRKIRKAEKISYLEGLHPKVTWVLKEQDNVKKSSKKLRPWTVNSEDDLAVCFELGIEAVHTDYPRRALALRAKNKQLTNEE